MCVGLIPQLREKIKFGQVQRKNAMKTQRETEQHLSKPQREVWARAVPHNLSKIQLSQHLILNI